jgi:hypothetical protein
MDRLAVTNGRCLVYYNQKLRVKCALRAVLESAVASAACCADFAISIDHDLGLSVIAWARCRATAEGDGRVVAH